VYARISAVNWSDVVQKSIVHGVDIAQFERHLLAMGLTIEPFAVADALLALSSGQSPGSLAYRSQIAPALSWRDARG
jgi:hypothetical protein